MISKVSFMGREECLTAPVKKAAKSQVYFAPDAPITDMPKRVMEKVEYKPAGVESYLASHGLINKDADAKLSALIAADSYKASHGIM